MAKILIGIALAVMLATAALGFLAKGNVDKIQTTLQGTKASLTTTEGKLRTTKTDLDKAQEDVKTATAKIEEQTTEVAAQKTKIDEATAAATAAKADVEDKTKQVADLEEKLRIAIANPTKPAAIVETPPGELDALRAQVAKAEAERAEAKQVAETMTNRVKETEQKMAALEQDKRRRETGMQRQGLTGRILAVNPGWNFVVLSVGDRQGILVNSPMLVMRGGEQIAKVRVTSVEPSTSIADVLPGTLRRGVTVQAGDTVITEGRAQAAPQQPAPAVAPATSGAAVR